MIDGVRMGNGGGRWGISVSGITTAFMMYEYRLASRRSDEEQLKKIFQVTVTAKLYSRRERRCLPDQTLMRRYTRSTLQATHGEYPRASASAVPIRKTYAVVAEWGLWRGGSSWSC